MENQSCYDLFKKRRLLSNSSLHQYINENSPHTDRFIPAQSVIRISFMPLASQTRFIGSSTRIYLKGLFTSFQVISNLSSSFARSRMNEVSIFSLNLFFSISFCILFVENLFVLCSVTCSLRLIINRNPWFTMTIQGYPQRMRLKKRL